MMKNERLVKMILVITVSACWVLFVATLSYSRYLTIQSVLCLILQLSVLSYLIAIVDFSTTLNLPFILLLWYFLTAYTAKFLIVMSINVMPLLALPQAPHQLTLNAGLIDSAALIMAGTSLVLTLFYYILRRFSASATYQAVNIEIRRSRVYWLTGGFLLFYIILSSLSLHLGIASMGKVQTALPFKIVGLLYYLRRFAIFAFILFLQYLACRDLRYVKLAAGVTAFYIIAEFLLSTSKAVLFMTVMSPLIMYYLTREISLRAAATIVGIIIGLIIVYPLLGAFRSKELGRIFFEGGLTLDLLVSSVKSYYIHYYGNTSIFAAGAVKLFSRMTGADMLLVILDHGAYSGGENPYLYLTRVILGMSLNEAHREAPGLLGFFQLLGGYQYVMIGLFIFMSLSFIYYRVLLFLLPQPLTATLFLMVFLMAIMDGVFDRNTLNVLLMTGVAALLSNGLFRFTCRIIPDCCSSIA